MAVVTWNDAREFGRRHIERIGGGRVVGLAVGRHPGDGQGFGRDIRGEVRRRHEHVIRGLGPGQRETAHRDGNAVARIRRRERAGRPGAIQRHLTHVRCDDAEDARARRIERGAGRAVVDLVVGQQAGQVERSLADDAGAGGGGRQHIVGQVGARIGDEIAGREGRADGAVAGFGGIVCYRAGLVDRGALPRDETAERIIGGAERGGIRTVVDLGGVAGDGRGQRRRGDRADSRRHRACRERVAERRHAAGGGHGESRRADGRGDVDIAAGIRRGVAPGPCGHGVAVEQPAHRHVGARQRCRRATVVSLTHASGQCGHGQRGRDAIEPSVAAAERRRPDGRVVLDEAGRQAVRRVERRIGRVDEPVGTAPRAHGRATGLIDEVSPGLERHARLTTHRGTGGESQISARGIHDHPARAADRLIDVDGMEGRQSQRGRGIGPADRGVDVDVAEPGALHAGTARSRRRRYLGDARAAVERGLDGGGGGAVDGEVRRVDQPGAGAALGRGSLDVGVADLHVSSGGLDRPTIASPRRTGVQRTADLHGARLPAAEQRDGAVVIFDRLGLHDAAIVDDAGQQRILRAGGHEHLTAVRYDQLMVRHQRSERAPVDLDVQQTVAAERERLFGAGSERNRPELGANHALVDDLLTEQRHIAAVRGCDRALVDHGARAAAAKLGRVGFVTRDQVERRGDETADIDLCTLAEQHAVRIDEPHLAVCVEMAEDLARTVAEDAIDGDRVGVRLDEVHGFLRADIETLPRERERLAALLYGRRIAGLNDLTRAPRHLATARTAGPCHRRTQQRQAHSHQHQRAPAAQRGSGCGAAACEAAAELGGYEPLRE